MASPLSSGIEGKVLLMPRGKPGIKLRRPFKNGGAQTRHALEKPPDKRVAREIIFSQAMTFSTSSKQHGGRTRSAERKVAMNFNPKYLYFNTI